jgi:single-strand DNA-binding protein
MANLNKVFLIGRLTRDPESRTTQGGTSVVNFGLAVNRTYTRKDSNERVEETCFVDVEAWGRTGETIARYTKKGRQILIEGRLKYDTWERDGQKRSRLTIVTEGFQFLDGGSGGGSREGGEAMEEEAGPRPARQPARAGAPSTSSGQTPQDDYGEAADDIPF